MIPALRYALIGLALLASPTAWGQGAKTNPTPGSVWTYLGSTYGADWVYGPTGGAITGIANNTALKGALTPTNGQIYRQGFATPGDGGGMRYAHSPAPCSINSGAGDDGSQVHAADGKCWLAVFPNSGADPLVFGADATGVRDSAPAIRAAISATSNVKFSPGLYSLCSTQPRPYSAVGPVGVLVRNKSNFTVDFGQAQFKVCDAVVKPSSGVESFLFDKVTNYTVLGGTFIGNMPTTTTGGLTAAICTMNAVGPKYYNQVFTGDWQSTSGGTGFCGDYIVNGLFSGAAALSPVTVGFDAAFLLNTRFVGFNLVGQHGSAPGDIGVSVIYDTPMLGQNTTGYTINDSSGVVIDGAASRFGAGWAVFSGSGYTIGGNYSGNVGSASSAGYGGVIGYNGSGSASSVGHPPTNLAVNGRYDNNGNATVVGGGILIQSGNIVNTDEIAGINVNASFYNNTTVAIEATSQSHVRDILVSADCRGALQTNCIGPNVLALSDPLRQNQKVHQPDR